MDHCSTFFAPAMTSLASATAQQFSSSCGTRCDSRRDCSSGLVCNPVSKTYDGDPGASTLSCPIPGCEPGKTFVNSNATAHNPEYCIGNNIYQFFNCSPEEQSLNFAAFYYIKLEELPTACNQSTPYKNSELLANMATGWFASGSSCFKEIVITAENGMSVTATVADTTSRARPDRWEGRESKVGEGGIGTVFKGTLPSGQIVAVKRIGGGSRQGDKQLKAEVIGSIHHLNLVKLVRFCLQSPPNVVVYANGLLDGWIFAKEKCLPWPTRLSRRRSRACVSPRWMPREVGYMAPELLHSLVMDKTDVYSFGIVLLELVCCMKAVEYPSDSQMDVGFLAQTAFNKLGFWLINN
ncbi:proline-rich receptor-like protein kinase PERK10 [Selaginella moellendorffii]|uniref:proline-rich receptor-like protein kinase PERK10 n=1 Tax=Selaginella moellendorffii TaxID=88036 RepID=UPI000D1C54B6|nr:proline-rich receptor-like protein kinase PERK10 [Selaginella moellendorffii]|eukprot:XP_024533684.1 proline-rich receptor-like protein kinase PERK10 [Selaginella moellendorffii]